MDFDSTVTGTYGSQEGAATGFNPSRKGQPSYHPLLAFEGATKGVLHSWWRTGKAYTGNGAAAFFAETLQRLPDEAGPYVVRADSGFFSDSFLSAIEQAGGEYLVKVKLRNLRALLARQDWQTIPGQPDTEYCEFTHQCEGWDRPRRFIAVRICRQVTTEGLLFPKYHYCHACYVTTLQEAPLEIHRCYRDRGEAETWIQAVKSQIGAGTTLVNEFWANALLWQLGVLAYNLTVWLRLLTDTGAWRQTPRTFREWFIRCAGKLTTHARRWTLKMQARYHWRPQWEHIYQQVGSLRL
ncbi:MAG: IS1380 family transposase [Balneolaceae bacterium]|nr:IS1380 family transposase [Balneolaceae bacterium]